MTKSIKLNVDTKLKAFKFLRISNTTLSYILIKRSLFNSILRIKLYY